MEKKKEKVIILDDLKGLDGLKDIEGLEDLAGIKEIVEKELHHLKKKVKHHKHHKHDKHHGKEEQCENHEEHHGHVHHKHEHPRPEHEGRGDRKHRRDKMVRIHKGDMKKIKTTKMFMEKKQMVDYINEIGDEGYMIDIFKIDDDLFKVVVYEKLDRVFK